MDAQASSSVAQDALSDDERAVSVVSTATTEGTSASVPNPWKKPMLPNGTPDTWSEKDVPVSAVAAPYTGAKQAAAPQPQPQRIRVRNTGGVDSSATDKAGKKESETAAGTTAGNGVPESGSRAATMAVHANGTMQASNEPAPAPPALVAVQKGPPISWRKILAGEYPK